MKRDFDRIRNILLECEASNDVKFPLKKFADGFDAYQIKIMEEAGLVEIDDPMKGTFTFRPGGTIGGAMSGLAQYKRAATFRITWAGHDYLDVVRDNGIWKKTKAAVSETGGSMTIEITKSLALGFLKKKISQHTGIDL